MPLTIDSDDLCIVPAGSLLPRRGEYLSERRPLELAAWSTYNQAEPLNVLQFAGHLMMGLTSGKWDMFDLGCCGLLGVICSTPPRQCTSPDVQAFLRSWWLFSPRAHQSVQGKVESP